MEVFWLIERIGEAYEEEHEEEPRGGLRVPRVYRNSGVPLEFFGFLGFWGFWGLWFGLGM